jgi:hypothetical protein
MIRRSAITALGILLISTQSLCASPSERLFVDTWCELEPFVSLSGDYPLSREKAAEILLEEARVAISGMIYGFSFSYTPSDAPRKVEDRFELKPLAEIPWGSARLAVLDMGKEEKRMSARIAYSLTDQESARRQSWGSNTIPMATGSGEASIMGGPGERLTALKEAVKNAVREHLRSRVYNKPREITGEALLWEGPETGMRSGSYVTRVKVRLRVDEIVPYRFY